MSDYTSFLFARPSFLEGVSRLLDFGNTMNEYNYSRNGDEADRRALRADVLAVGDDIRNVQSRVIETPNLLSNDD